MAAIYGSGRSTLPPLSLALGSSGTFTSVGTWYFWIQAKNAIGYNLVSNSVNALITATSSVTLTLPVDCYRNGEYWEEFYISASQIDDPNTSCIICVIPALTPTQDVITLPFSFTLNKQSQLTLNASVANPTLLPADVINGMIREVTSLGYVYKYNAYSVKPFDGVYVLDPGSSLSGAWELYKDGFNINITDLQSSLGCNQYLNESTDLSRISDLVYNANGSAGFYRTFWILNTNAENIPKSTKVGFSLYVNSADVSDSLAGLLKIEFLGYSDLVTGLLDTISEDNINPMPGVNTIYNYEPNKTDLQLPKPLLSNYAYVARVYPQFNSYQAGLSLPNGSSLTVLPFLYDSLGVYSPIGELLGDFISLDSDLRRALPRQGLSLKVGEGSGIVKSYQFKNAPEVNIFGLLPNNENQLLVIDGNGTCYISSAPTDREAIRAAISTKIATTSVISIPNVAGNASAVFTITVTHPALTNTLARIKSNYPDLIADSYAYFNPSNVRVIIKNSSNIIKYADVAIDTSSSSQVINLNLSALDIFSSTIPNDEGFFSIVSAQAVSNGTGSSYTVYVAYYYDGNTVSKINHTSNTYSVIPEGIPNLNVGSIDRLSGIGLEYIYNYGSTPLIVTTNTNASSNAIITIPKLDRNSIDVTNYLTRISSTGEILQLSNQSDGTYRAYKIESSDTTGANSVIFTCTKLWGNLILDNLDKMLLQWTDKYINLLNYVSSNQLATAFTAHSNASNPHPIYLNQTEGDDRYPLISTLPKIIDDRIVALLTAGANITLTYSNTSNTLTIASTASGSSGHIIQEEGSSLPTRSKLNFVGASVTATDEAANDATVVNVSASPTPGSSFDGGAITGSGSASSVVCVSATLPNGGGYLGSSFYSYEWHCSATDGFLPTSGNLVSGETGSGATITGLTNGTIYYIRRIAIDPVGNKTSTPQITATAGGNAPVSLIPQMTSNSTPSPYIASSNSEAGLYPAYQGFDKSIKDDGTARLVWSSNNQVSGVYLRFFFGSNKTLSIVEITARTPAPEQSPTNFNIQTSTNGTSWTTVSTQTAQSWTGGEKKTYTFSPMFVSYVQILVSAVGSGNIVGIAEMDALG